MKKLIVFGATGGTGKLVVEQALNAGYVVTVVVRNPAAFDLQHAQLKIFTGDVLVPSTLKAALSGQDIVVSCLGMRNTGPTQLYSQGVRNIIEAMQRENVNRIICLSAAAVIIPPRGSAIMKFVVKYILQRIFKYSYADMLLMEEMLRGTNLNWTVIRPPRLIDGKKKGVYRSSINEPLKHPSKISRADLADYIVNHLSDDATFKGLAEVSY
jgi:putative NADH-flavin reductase